MLLQLDSDAFLSLFAALALSLTVAGSLYLWTKRVRRLRLEVIDQLLLTQLSIPLTEVSYHLDPKGMDSSTLLSLIRLSPTAILSFSGANIVSRPLVSSRLRTILLDEGALNVAREANTYTITEAQIREIVHVVVDVEKLDVVETIDGNFLMVTDFKTKVRDQLDLQGRFNITSEAQRMGVERPALLEIVENWGWELLDTPDGLLISRKWLKESLKRTVNRTGYLHLESEAGRLGLSAASLQRALRAFGWRVVSTTDNHLIPRPLLEKELLDRMELLGILDLKVEAERLKVDQKDILDILRAKRLNMIQTSDGSVALLEHLKERILDDLDLTGRIDPEEEAKTLGITTNLVKGLIEKEDGIRKTSAGHYVSVTAFRAWLLDEVKENGFVKAIDVERSWGLSNLQFQMLMKRFGLRTVVTKGGNYLSIAWVKRRINHLIKSGLKVEPDVLAEQLDMEHGDIEAIMSQVDSDAFLDRSGALIPKSVLVTELMMTHKSKGILDLEKEAAERGVDVSELEELVVELRPESFETPSGKLVAISAIERVLNWSLQKKGIYDLRQAAQGLKIDYKEMADAIEPRLNDDSFIDDKAGVVVSTNWIGMLRNYAKEQGAIKVTSFARERNIRRSAALSLLRRFLKGAYVSRSDSFIVAG